MANDAENNCRITTSILYRFLWQSTKHKDFKLPLLLETMLHFRHQQQLSTKKFINFQSSGYRQLDYFQHSYLLGNISPIPWMQYAFKTFKKWDNKLSTITTEETTFWILLYHLSQFNPSTLHSSKFWVSVTQLQDKDYFSNSRATYQTRSFKWQQS